MVDTILKVTDLHAGYGSAEVLHGLNFRADKGSVITVIGPNGAGKSTLLNALMGALPSRGEIAYDGRAIGMLELEERVMQGMSLVPETRALFASMSIIFSRPRSSESAFRSTPIHHTPAAAHARIDVVTTDASSS